MEMGVIEGCLIAEEFAYGCSGIKTAIEGSGLGVSTVLLIHFANCLRSGLGVSTDMLIQITPVFILI
jgi:hypothetical protein